MWLSSVVEPGGIFNLHINTCYTVDLGNTRAWKRHDARGLTGERGSPGLTPGRHHNQTSSAQSRWFRGALAGWTGCGGRGSLCEDITNMPRGPQSCFMYTQRGHTASPHTRTFESESIVTHAFTQILPHHIFHIFQRARLQWGVEARPLTTIGQNIAVVMATKEASCEPLPFPSMTDVSSPGKSWAHCRWVSHHCPSLTLWRFDSGLLHKGVSSGTERQQRSRFAQGWWSCTNNVEGALILLQLSSRDNTEGPWGAELLSERSKIAQRCSSGFWLNTVDTH